jgi:hypothetical protein
MQSDLHQNNHNAVIAQEDPETGDLLVPIPEKILEQLGWNENTILEIEILGHGVISVVEKHEKQN